jgi:hypothetical protein
VEPRSGHRAEARELVGRDVDRPTPARGDRSRAEAREQFAQAAFGAGLRREILEDPQAYAVSDSEPARAAPHEDAPVGCRAEVMQEHAAVDDRLTAGPADLVQQLRYRLGENDRAAEVRLAAAERPLGAPDVKREHHLACPDGAAGRLEHRLRARADGRDRCVLEHPDPARDPRPPEREDEACRLHRGTVAEDDPAAEARRVAPAPHLGRVEKRGFLFDTECAHGLEGMLDLGVLRLAGGHLEHAAFAEPDVLAAALAERAYGRHDFGRGVRELQCATVSQDPPERRERRPVTVQETTVPAARPVADLARLEQRYRE